MKGGACNKRSGVVTRTMKENFSSLRRQGNYKHPVGDWKMSAADYSLHACCSLLQTREVDIIWHGDLINVSVDQTRKLSLELLLKPVKLK